MKPCSVCKDDTPENLQVAKWEARDNQEGENIICPYCLHNYFLPMLAEVSLEVFLGRESPL